jgi:hypothetical protein
MIVDCAVYREGRRLQAEAMPLAEAARQHDSGAFVWVGTSTPPLPDWRRSGTLSACTTWPWRMPRSSISGRRSSSTTTGCSWSSCAPRGKPGPCRWTHWSGRHPPTTTTRCCCPAAPSTPTSHAWIPAPSDSSRPSWNPETGRRDLPRPVDIAGGRRRERAHGDSYPSIRTDLRNAGATVVDQEVATDGNLITSRSPKDLPAFCAALIDAIAVADQWADERADQREKQSSGR